MIQRTPLEGRSMQLEELFHVKKPIIGMLHLKALPGAPSYMNDFQRVLDIALSEVTALVAGGIDGIIVENFGDTPFYPDHVPPHTTAFMTRITTEVKQRFDLPLGLNVLRNDAQAAMAIASATGAEFIRVNIHTGCMVTDQGLIQGTAHETLRLRTQLQSKVRIFADVLVKHAVPLGPQLPDQAARDAYYRGQADALIVSGPETGVAPNVDRLRIIRKALPTAPILMGSGLTLSNLETYLEHADGFIIGTWLKKDEITTNPVDEKKVRQLMAKVQELRA